MTVRALLALAAAAAANAAYAEQYYLIVAGLGGEPRYAQSFSEAANELASAARRTVGDESRVVLLEGEGADRESVREAFRRLADAARPADSVIVFLIGHGSYDGEQYKFNLPGPDIDGEELGELLASLPAASQLIVNTSSASGAVLESWAADGRTVITATRSGFERNATRFAEHWAAALSSDEADANKNGVITATEAFEYAARRVSDSFEAEGTLATEHPQIKGDAAGRFTVARLASRAAVSPEQEQLFSERDRLEGEIDALRQRREEMTEDAYFDALQALLLELATVQQEIDANGDTGNDGSR